MRKFLVTNFGLIIFIILVSFNYGYSQQQKKFIVTSCEVKKSVGGFFNDAEKVEKNEIEDTILGQPMVVNKFEGINGLSKVTRYKFNFIGTTFTLENSYGMGGFKKFNDDEFKLLSIDWFDKEFPNGLPSNLVLHVKTNHKTLGKILFIIHAKYTSN